MELPGFNLRWGQCWGVSGLQSGVSDCSEAFSSGNYAFFSVLALFLRVLVAKLCVFMAFLGKKNKPPKEPGKRIVMRFSPRKGTIKETGVSREKSGRKEGLGERRRGGGEVEEEEVA